MAATSQIAELFNDYDGFTEKFKPKKTTDDCYTPDAIYDVILSFCCDRYGVEPSQVVRPFWPGADYTSEDYAGKVVIDNPPFSIMSKVVAYYIEHGVKFFLFCPGLTAFNPRRYVMELAHVFAGQAIEYENGAKVRTEFVTNLEPAGVVAVTVPGLGAKIKEATDKLRIKSKKQTQKYSYPANVLTAARLSRLAHNGASVAIKANECYSAPALDSQVECGKAIFGGGLVVTDSVADAILAEEKQAKERREVAEHALETVWELSERERSMLEALGQ